MAALCDVTSFAETTCCDPQPAGGPGVIDNPPGQRALRYRLGTFATFRQAMLDVAPQRMPQWKDRSQRDYGVALLEMWATLGDILTFYQERIANEAFLRPAVLRESVVRLAALVDYRLNPGAAANAYLAFTVAKGQTVPIPLGFRAQTKPAPGAAPVPFETAAAVTALDTLNRFHPQSLQVQTLGYGDQDAILQGTKTGLRPGDPILIVGQERFDDAGREEWELRRVTAVIPDKTQDTTRITWQEPLGHRQPRVAPPAVPKLYALRLRAWPFGSAAPDYASLIYTTTQTTGPKNKKTIFTTTTRPSFPDWTGRLLPEDAQKPDQLFLDTLYPLILTDSWVILATGDPVDLTPGSLDVTHPQGYVEVFRVLRVVETVHANYTLNAKVTRLTLDTVPGIRGGHRPEHLNIFPIKGTTVLAQSEELVLAPVPVTTPVAGDTLVLDAVYPDLARGRTLLLTGQAPGGTQIQREVLQVKEVVGARITLQAGLQYRYDPATVVIYGNVAAASQGETIPDEILGSGDAAQLFQSFTLKKSPLTFVRATGRDANRWGTQAALAVRVGGVRWQERPNLLGSGPADRVYTLDIGPDDAATITFGAGAPGQEVTDAAAQPTLGGARLPSGRDNVHARYRKGLGLQGNVKPQAITTLVNTVPGLQTVTNPLAGTGGADRESIDQVKTNVPAVMRAFDRAISLADYAALARTYTGVAKARAFWESKDPADPTGRRRLEQARVLLTVAATDRTPPLQPVFKQALRAFLDARRDPNQPLRIIDFIPISVDLRVKIQPAADLLAENVLAAVAAALSAGPNPDGTLGLFAFERLDFGQSLNLSDIYAVVQAVPGVDAALVSTFRHQPRPDELTLAIPDVETHIFIRNTEILRCDNDPTDPTRGTLTLEAGEVASNGV